MLQAGRGMSEINISDVSFKEKYRGFLLLICLLSFVSGIVSLFQGAYYDVLLSVLCIVFCWPGNHFTLKMKADKKVNRE